MSVLYHPDKANVVADALSCMTMGSVSHVEDGKKYLMKDVHMLARSEDSTNGGFVVHPNSESSLVVEVESKKHLDPLLMELTESVLGKFNESISEGEMV